MHPILFHIGSFPIRAYSLAVAGAVIAGAYFAAWLGRRRGLSWATVYTDFALWAFMGGVVGARIWEVAFKWSFFRSRPQEIFAIWQGGLSIQGGVLGGLIVAWVYARHNKIRMGRFLDGLAPALLLAQAIGRLLGCTFNGDAFGKPTGMAFGLVPAPGTLAYETYGAQPLWPAEVFEGIYDLALMACLLRLGVNKGPAGRHFLLYAVLYSGGRFMLEFLRADTARILAGLTAAQLGSLFVLVVGSSWLARQSLVRADRSRVAQEQPAK